MDDDGPERRVAGEPVVVRRATAADDPARLRALRLEMLADNQLAFIEPLADAERLPPSGWADRLRRYTLDRDRILFVAETGERWVGQAGGYLDESGRSHLVSVYLTPIHRGDGLLERLFEAVSQWARERGCPDMRLEVAAANLRAVSAYERLGFRPTGHRKPHPLFPREHVEIEMMRLL